MNRELSFLVEKVLKRETNTFLDEIERLMTEDGVGDVLATEKKNNRGPGKVQFKNLMDATGQAACIEELLLFISYQKSKKSGWEAVCCDGKDMAEYVAVSFMKVEDEVYEILKKELAQKEIDSEDERLLRLEIAKKYMGYLYWKASICKCALGRESDV